MAVVDRNLLRLATYEMMAHRNTPSKVVLNEAIEMAKNYGGEESGNFINGVLDRIRFDLDREN
jgi:N utilization substance protein B